jgi:hypothetical protein
MRSIPGRGVGERDVVQVDGHSTECSQFLTWLGRTGRPNPETAGARGAGLQAHATGSGSGAPAWTHFESSMSKLPGTGEETGLFLGSVVFDDFVVHVLHV